MSVKLVLDTNTIISGLLWKENEFKLLELIEQGRAELFISEEIFKELSRVLNYPKLEKYIVKSGLTVEELLEKISSLSNFVFVKNKVNLCRDPNDDKIIECALSAKVNYIITGDKDLLVLKQVGMVKIIRTFEVLKFI